MNLLLDTHAWVWWSIGSMRIPETARKAIQSASDDGRLFLSAISVWEVAKLVSKGRLQLDRDIEDWVDLALEIPGLHLVPLTPGIACGSSTLPPPFHNDPADQIIVATARSVGATVVTIDDRIRHYPHCKTLW